MSIHSTPSAVQTALKMFGAPRPKTEVAGVPRLTAWISMDVPDTDFQVMLYEVLEDGSSVLLSSDYPRARYRESLEREVLIQPGAVLRYQFDSFTFFARRIKKGSRLRLVFSVSNSIYKQKNYRSRAMTSWICSPCIGYESAG